MTTPESPSPSPLSGPPATPWHIEVLEGLRGRLLARLWPAVFPAAPGDPIVPLIADVEFHLVPRLIERDVDGIMLIKETLRRYCGSGQYLGALARDHAMRHNLRGQPIELVSERDRAEALRRLESLRQAAIKFAPPKTMETIMVTIKALKITAVLPAEQLQPTGAATVVLSVATPDGAKATAKITGKAYRRALTQIAALGVDQAVVVLQGSMRRSGEIEGGGLSIQPRKASPPASAVEPAPAAEAPESPVQAIKSDP